MADTRIDGEGAGAPRSDTQPGANLGTTGADRLPAGHALPGGSAALDRTAATTSDDPDAVRAEIEQTRERMSDTIDEIENALTRKREQLQEKLDILSPVKQRPLPSAGISFGVGLVLGLLTGGDDDDEGDDDDGYSARAFSRSRRHVHSGSDSDSEDWEARSHMWQERAQRLLRVAREQEEEIRELQERYGKLYSRDLDLNGFGDEELHGALTAGVTGWRDQVLGGITNFLNDTFRQMQHGGESHG